MQTISVATMKAVRAHGYGDAGMLSFEDAPLPSPGEGEVLVRVHAASVNPADWKLRAIIPGRDVSGVVEAVGPGVTRFAHGDAVFGNADGAYAQYAVANEAALAR
jgi:NADPH:quinone reductase-like Zn-dependent oxidoreductase